jgi:hypothetical protein
MILEPPKKCPFPIANHMPRMIPNKRPGFQNSYPIPRAVSRNTNAPNTFSFQEMKHNTKQPIENQILVTNTKYF